MIFNLSDDFIDNKLNIQHFYDSLTNILRSATEGKHIVCISPLKVRELLKDTVVQERHELNELLTFYNSRFKSLNIINIEKYFNLIVNVTTTKENYFMYSSLDKKIEYRELPYTVFLDTARIQKTILLGEHRDDIKVFAKFVDYYKNTSGLTSFNSSFTRRGGGGNTINTEYDDIYTDDDNFALCLLDSDKKFPLQTKYGDTAQFVKDYHTQEVLRENINLKVSYIILDVLELENLLPKDFYISKYSTKASLFSTIEEFVSLSEKFRHYFDFKKGIVCKSSFNESHNRFECAGYLKDYLCPLVEQSQLTTSNNETLVHGFQGRRGNILRDFIKLDINTIIKYVQLDVFVLKYWNELGKYIASHVLVQPVQRSI